MIEHKDRYVTSWMVASHLLKHYEIDVSKMSGQQVIDALFGDIYDSGPFAIVDKCHNVDVRWHHRLNRLWAYPLAILISPVQYVIFDNTGFSDRNVLGRVVLKLTGYR